MHRPHLGRTFFAPRSAPRPRLSRRNRSVLFEINAPKCVGCLACVRVCPAGAVAVDGAAVSIVDEACIRCGMCVPACPHGAIDSVGDLATATALAARGGAVLILTVEAAAYFYPQAPEQVINACYQAGFRAVHHGVLGDELVAEEYVKLWADPDWGTLIRSTCPVIVETIRHQYPELVPYLAPVKTPVAAEAQYLKRLYGRDVPLVYAGVCLTEGVDDVDASVTFDELGRLLAARGVAVSEQPAFFERIPEERRRHMSTAGGLPLRMLQEEHQASRRFRKVRGMGGLAALARAAVEEVDLGFVDILPCEGCLDHPLLGPREELYWRRQVVVEAEPKRSALPVLDPEHGVDVSRGFAFVRNGHQPAADQIERVIETIGRTPAGTPWDCGACGYATCAAFAAAQLKGRATYRQCPPYQERRLAEAEREAAVDGLTGLATYRVLQARLAQEIARSERSGDPFAVMFVDLDHFKRLNDLYGHRRGNDVLEAVGRELLQVIRSTDVAARYGGDEFVVILVRTNAAGGRRVAEAVRRAVEEVGPGLGFGPGEVTASLGVAGYEPAHKGQDILDAADRALYRAKAGGGNGVV
jgi:diguanylate cyclase (GGDEF)-like protein